MPDLNALLPQIKKLVVERLFLDVPAENIGDDDNLLEKFGVDSVRMFEIVVGLEEAFGVSFADQEFSVDRFATPRKIAEVVAGKTGA
ncbi:MAG TPA: acyl carrier protein [Planctomycetota bacterium]|nr:acyl carrier protein [Planctomycetota bacterium]